MQAAVRGIDSILRKSQGIHKFTDDPECILRIQLKHSAQAVKIGVEKILKGDVVLAVHVWNERIPQIPPEGADLKWALGIKQKVIHSFRVLAMVMVQDYKYAQVRALCGTSTLFSSSVHVGGMRMMQHLGFTVLPYHRPLGRFGEFWENLFSWWMMWTFNNPSLNSREFWGLQRTEIWMTAKEFIRRYGNPV
jgi:YkoP domain